MPTLEIMPTHKVVAAYYDNLAKFAKLCIKHEGAVRSAFHELLEHCARQFDWKRAITVSLETMKVVKGLPMP